MARSELSIDSTPVEIKEYIVALYEQLPYMDFETTPSQEDPLQRADDDIDPFIVRRGSSQVAKELKQMMAHVFEVIDPLTHPSPYYRRCVEEILNMVTQIGVDKNNPTRTPLYELLGLDIADGFSMADISLMPLLESRGYRQALKNSLLAAQSVTSQQAIDRVLDRHPRDSQVAQGYMHIFVRRRARGKRWTSERELGKWRLDYIERYKDEP
jgi:hypothetical protein